MDKKFLAILLIVAFFATFVSAQEEFEAGTGELNKQDLILAQSQQSVLQTSAISTKLDEFALTNTKNLEIVAELLLLQQSETQTNLIICIIIVVLASQGLWWAIFFYFQTKGLIQPLKIAQKNVKKTENKEKPLNLQELLESG